MDGWALSLQLVDSVYNMAALVCRCVRSAVGANMLDGHVSQVVSNTELLRDHVRFIWSEGVGSFNRVITMRESLYKP